MKIFYLSTGIFKDRFGQQAYEWYFLSSLLKEYPDAQLRAFLLNDYSCHPLWPHKDYANIEYIFCGHKNRLFSKIKFVLNAFWYILKEEPKIIICGHIHLSFICLIAGAFFKIKYILLTYGIEVWGAKSKLELKALKRALNIVAISRYTVSKITGLVSLPQEKFFLLPPALDRDRFMPQEKSKQLLNRHNLNAEKIILTIARLDSSDRDKGYDKVLRVLPEVIKAVPDIRYLLVGRGTDITRVKKIVEGLGLASYVKLAGFVPDEEIAQYFNLCDCFVMPSKQEGFGIVFLEALACGRPVIAGNRDGSGEALLDGELGILIDPDNQEDLKDAIINVLNREVPERLWDRAFLSRRVNEEFGLDKFRDRVKGLLDTALDKK